MKRDNIENIIKNSFEEVNEQLPGDQQLNYSPEEVLFGSGGNLDSLGLVSLLVIIEQNIEEEFDTNITIADERAMSQKNSPFRTVSALIDYIELLLN